MNIPVIIKIDYSYKELKNMSREELTKIFYSYMCEHNAYMKYKNSDLYYIKIKKFTFITKSMLKIIYSIYKKENNAIISEENKIVFNLK